VKVVKWVLIGLAGVFCSATCLRGDDADDLLNQADDAVTNGQYDVAAKLFDQLSATYPNAPNIDEIRLGAGFAYLHLKDFPSAIDRLASETTGNVKPQYRGVGLYYTGLAQYSLGQKLADTDKDASNLAFTQAAATFTTLGDFSTANPGNLAPSYLEDAAYYRALAEFGTANYNDAEKDLIQLLQPAFNASLKRPDYLFMLGNLYAAETGQAIDASNDPQNTAKKTPDEIKALAQKAMDAFDQVSRDPNALIQANNANLSRAEVLYLIAPLEPTSDGYASALEAFHLVRSKNDMIQLQQNHLADLTNAAQRQDVNAPGSIDYSQLIAREQNQLEELQNATDPIIQALIRIAECYLSLKQSDEARTVLHRLVAHAPLTPGQKQEVDFEILFSYVLGGQTDKADKALTDYLANHAGDAQADSISYQIAAKLLERKDYAGALKQAEKSLTDFPNGRFAADAITVKVQALTGLGQISQSDQVVQEFLQQDPTNPVANNMLLVRAQNEASRQDFNAALADYQTIKNNRAAGPELQAIAAADYIQVLRSMNRFDDVLAESKIFKAKYPNSKALPQVLFYTGLAMDHKSDQGAFAVLEEVAQKYPASDAAPSALYYLVTMYQRTGNVPATVKAADDLRKAYPAKYDFLIKAADIVAKEYLKQRKFDQAAAEYQPLADHASAEIASAARNKIGDIWLAAAKAMGTYQSLPVPARNEALKKLTTAEQSYLSTLKDFPGQIDAVGEAFQGLTNALKQRHSWGLVTEAGMEASLDKTTTDLTSPEMRTRVELAKAALVFVYKNGAKQYPAALERFKKAINAAPGLRLSRREAAHFGDLLFAGKDYTAATQVYTDLLATSNDPLVQADGDYGLGAIYLAQGDVAKARDYFSKMTALPDGAAWHPHILDAEYGLALADEQSYVKADNDKARATYARIMQEPQAGILLQAEAMLGYGRLLEKTGNAIRPAPQGPGEYAIHYYKEPHTLFGPAVPELSAQGLFLAGQAYEKARDRPNAKKLYTDLIHAYGQTAPDWAAKARAALTHLGP
jgi:tetratricopeptide (TPR) repeat protein